MLAEYWDDRGVGNLHLRLTRLLVPVALGLGPLPSPRSGSPAPLNPLPEYLSPGQPCARLPAY